jgi:hypothetical protein
LILGYHSFAANCSNGWFSRRVATTEFYQLQQFPRCERTQRKINRSGVGSFLPLAARRMNVSYASLVLFSLH